MFHNNHVSDPGLAYNFNKAPVTLTPISYEISL